MPHTYVYVVLQKLPVIFIGIVHRYTPRHKYPSGAVAPVMHEILVAAAVLPAVFFGIKQRLLLLYKLYADIVILSFSKQLPEHYERRACSRIAVRKARLHGYLVLRVKLIKSLAAYLRKLVKLRERLIPAPCAKCKYCRTRITAYDIEFLPILIHAFHRLVAKPVHALQIALFTEGSVCIMVYVYPRCYSVVKTYAHRRRRIFLYKLTLCIAVAVSKAHRKFLVSIA